MRRLDIEYKIIGRKFKPYRKDGVFILEDDVSSYQKQDSGLYIDNTNSSFKFRRATVVAIGEHVKALKIGDRVLFDKAYGPGHNINHQDDVICRLLYITANQIECLIEDDNINII